MTTWRNIRLADLNLVFCNGIFGSCASRWETVSSNLNYDPSIIKANVHPGASPNDYSMKLLEFLKIDGVKVGQLYDSLIASHYRTYAYNLKDVVLRSTIPATGGDTRLNGKNMQSMTLSQSAKLAKESAHKWSDLATTSGNDPRQIQASLYLGASDEDYSRNLWSYFSDNGERLVNVAHWLESANMRHVADTMRNYFGDPSPQPTSAIVTSFSMQSATSSKQTNWMSQPLEMFMKHFGEVESVNMRFLNKLKYDLNDTFDQEEVENRNKLLKALMLKEVNIFDDCNELLEMGDTFLLGLKCTVEIFVTALKNTNEKDLSSIAERLEEIIEGVKDEKLLEKVAKVNNSGNFHRFLTTGPHAFDANKVADVKKKLELEDIECEKILRDIVDGKLLNNVGDWSGQRLTVFEKIKLKRMCAPKLDKN